MAQSVAALTFCHSVGTVDKKNVFPLISQKYKIY